MRSFFLDKQDIIKITGQRFYKRGYDYFKKGRVYGLSYNPTINSWKGRVRGTEPYNVRIFFFENDDLEASCDCPAYATHYTCKHIAAVLLAIGQDSWKQLHRVEKSGDTLLSRKKDNHSFSTRIIEAFSDTSQRRYHGTPEALEIEYIIGSRINPHNSRSFLEIELKIGTNKMYIVKNIREFLIHLKKGKPYQVTPTFKYQPSVHQIDEIDQAIFTDLNIAYENESIYENSFSNPLFEKRTLVIPPSVADSLLEKFDQHNNVYFKGYDGEIVKGISFKRSVDELNFQLDKYDEETFHIDISDLIKYTYLEIYGYLYNDGHFQKINVEQQSVMDQLYSLLPYRTEQAHPISKENMKSFITNVIPKLEKVGKIKYSKNAKQHITIEALKTKLFINERKNSLSINVEFHYGKKIVKPYQDDRLDDAVIKRDLVKELEIVQELEKAGFVYINGQFQLFKTEAIYQFLHEQLPILQRNADVYLSETVRAMLSNQHVKLSSSIDLENKTGMLDIRFNIEGITESDVQNVLAALIEKKNYYRIPDGALLSLDGEGFNSFKELAEQLQLSKSEFDGAELKIPAARSFQVEDVLTPSHFQYSEAFQNLLTELKNPNQLNFDLPNELHAELRDYQHTGYQWFKTLSHYHLGGILADDMGLGKTLQTITYLLSEKQSHTEPYKALVVVPASLLYNWKKEFEKFAPTMNVEVVAGSKQKRLSTIKDAKHADVFITSYPLLRKDVDIYENAYFDVMILDEAQAIKNHLTQTAKAARLIKAGNRFALSGTPIENSLDELWSIFHTISPGLFGNKKSFLTYDHEYIAKITRPFILRRIKKDVLHELPDKIETVQYSELTKNQKEVYIAYVERMQQQLDQTIQEKGFEKGKIEILAGITRLRQVCCHPSLFLDNYTGKSGKLEHLKELLQELAANGKRALIFSQFSSMLKIIHSTLEKENIDTFYLDGSTPSEQRVDMVDQFNQGEKSVFLISLKAGGTGLNLTGADTVILFDLWWNPAVEEQAAGRAHRIGQKNVVQVIRMITEGTIEEKIYELQHKKRELVDQIIQPGETMLSKLSEEEIRELLKMKA